MMSDTGSVANMPQESKQHAWPSVREGFEDDINDTITGIDQQMGADLSKAKQIKNPMKW